MNEKILKARDKHKSIPDEDEDTKTQQEDGEDDAEMTKHFGLLKTHKCSQAQKSCANMKWLQNEEVMVEVEKSNIYKTQMLDRVASE